MEKIFLLLSFFSILAYSRPPEDQILLPPPREKGVRILRNKNVTYTNDQPEDKGPGNIIRTVFSVKGRSRPDRTGKIVSQIPSGSPITPMKYSKDKKWVAIIVRSSGVRAWIPKSALPKLDNNLRLTQKVDKLDQGSGRVRTSKVKSVQEDGEE